VPAGSVTDADIMWLERSNFAGPVYERLALYQLDDWLRSGEMRLFRVKPDLGVILVSVRSGGGGARRLCVVRSAMARGAFGFRMRQILAILGRLAREWDCVAVETVCYDRRLATALARGGATEEATVMVLQVAEEKTDGLS
jgi:hypothetical protein